MKPTLIKHLQGINVFECKHKACEKLIIAVNRQVRIEDETADQHANREIKRCVRLNILAYISPISAARKHYKTNESDDGEMRNQLLPLQSLLTIGRTLGKRMMKSETAPIVKRGNGK